MNTRGLVGCVIWLLSMSGCAGETEETESPLVSGPGWSLRDDVPYAHGDRALFVDERHDRLVMFGGAADDLWELPLSGADARTWAQLSTRGQRPSPAPIGGGFRRFTAHDHAGARLLVLSPGGAARPWGLFQLSLGGEPTWTSVAIPGEAPITVEHVAESRVAFDVGGNRLFVVVTSSGAESVWSLSLDGVPAWQRWADLPESFALDGAVVVDAERHQVVLSSVTSNGTAPDGVWALSLQTNTWRLLGPDRGYGGPAVVLDAEHDRLVRSTESGDLQLFSLVSGTMTSAWLPPGSRLDSSAAVVDAKRNRLLLLAGNTNAVSAIDLDAFVPSELSPPSRVNRFEWVHSPGFVWDPVRASVVSTIDPDASTVQRGLNGSSDWSPVSTSGPHYVSLVGRAPTYDSTNLAIVSVGSDGTPDEVHRLPSEPGAAWERWEAGPGPAGDGHLAVHDVAGNRVIVHGGTQRAPLVRDLGDVWALSLDVAPTWRQLEVDGPIPAARAGHVGVYDPGGRRMVLYGGQLWDSSPLTDLWSLSLGESPRWTLLAAAGTGPGTLHMASAVYDPSRRRMIVVTFQGDLPFQPLAARVFALDLEGAVVWHQLCSPGLTPLAQSGTGNAVLTPDGLFLVVGGASFRFDLDTPYCDAP